LTSSLVAVALVLALSNVGSQPGMIPVNGQAKNALHIKQAVLAQEQSARAAARKGPYTTDKSDNPAKPPQYTAAPRKAGIVQMHQGPFPASEFLVDDFWGGPAPDQSKWLLVYAGKSFTPLGSSSSKAALAIYSEPMNPNNPTPMASVGVFVAPDGSSSLRITAASGSRLTVITSAGNSYFFNLASDSYSVP
jgi:hypothetical protein